MAGIYSIQEVVLGLNRLDVIFYTGGYGMGSHQRIKNNTWALLVTI